jgi:16S rRNA (cytidine1402-2'-O)-methyltransferase
MSGVLSLVATPIGNLGDMSHRAVETLKNADWIACEDTRHSKFLLDHYGIHKPLISYHDFSESRKAPELVRRLQQGEKGALISDAGTPGIADPGYRLITQAIEAGVKVEALPGPAAFLTALVLSGFPMNRFSFEGFAPLKDAAKKKWFAGLAQEERTIVFYESPHRLVKTLEAMKHSLGDVRVAVARELTKKFEEVRRDRLSALIEHFSRGKVLGEFVVVWSPRE